MPETILVIEDDYATRACLIDFLEDKFTVITAADGAKGLQLSREALPDLIICDIDMPYLNGYQVLEQLRADINTAQIPFIFLSAHSSSDKIALATKMGADDYLIKPVKLTQLLVTIQSKIKKKAINASFIASSPHISPVSPESESLRKCKYGCAAKKYLNSTILTAVDDWHNYGHIAAYGLNHNS